MRDDRLEIGVTFDSSGHASLDNDPLGSTFYFTLPSATETT